jgi:outer membrane protein
MKQLIYPIMILLLLLPVQMSATTCTIDVFLQAVDQHNPDLQLAQRDLELASVQKREARSLALPKIGAQGSYSRNLKRNYMYVEMPTADSLGNIIDIPMSFPINKNNEYAFNVALSQTLFSFNVGYALKAASQYRELTGEIYRASRQGILTWARKAFYGTLLLEEVLEITQAATANAEDNFLLMQSRRESGLASEFALMQAEVRWQSLLPEVTRAERNLEVAYNNLRQMAGWPLSRELELQGDLENLPQLPKLPEMDEVLQTRPDYNALKWEERLRRTGIKSDRSNHLPTLSGSFIYSYRSQSDDWALDQERNNSWIAGMTLNIPIFSGGYTSARVERSRLELSKNQLRLERLERDIQSELVNIHLRLQEASARIITAETTRETAGRAFAIAESGVSSGLVTQLELKDARLYLDNARLGYYSATWEYLSAWFDWQLALGNVGLED